MATLSPALAIPLTDVICDVLTVNLYKQFVIVEQKIYIILIPVTMAKRKKTGQNKPREKGQICGLSEFQWPPEVLVRRIWSWVWAGKGGIDM